MIEAFSSKNARKL